MEWETPAKNGDRSVLLRSDEVGKFRLTDTKNYSEACPVRFLTKFAKPDAASTQDTIEAVVKHLDTLDTEIRRLLEKTGITTCSQAIQAFVQKHAEKNEVPGTRFYKRHVDDIVNLHMGDFKTDGATHNPVALYLLKVTRETKERWAKGVDNTSAKQTISSEKVLQQIKIRA